MQRLDLGRGEGERIDEGLGAQAVAGGEHKRHGPVLAGPGEGVGQLGDDEGVIALGRARQRDGAALLEPANGGSDGTHWRLRPTLAGARPSLSPHEAPPPRAQAVVCRVRAESARSPVIQASISGSGRSSRLSNSAISEFRSWHGKLHVREPAHHEIHLAQAAPPGAEQNSPPSLVERGAA